MTETIKTLTSQMQIIFELQQELKKNSIIIDKMSLLSEKNRQIKASITQIFKKIIYNNYDILKENLLKHLNARGYKLRQEEIIAMSFSQDGLSIHTNGNEIIYSIETLLSVFDIEQPEIPQDIETNNASFFMKITLDKDWVLEAVPQEDLDFLSRYSVSFEKIDGEYKEGADPDYRILAQKITTTFEDMENILEVFQMYTPVQFVLNRYDLGRYKLQEMKF